METLTLKNKTAEDQALYCKIIDPSNAKYADLQQAVSEKYKKVYGAEIVPKPDVFSLLTNFETADIAGACFGITSGNKVLFSEQYLNLSLEHVVHQVLGRHVSRHNIAEVGSLVSSGIEKAGQKLMEMMPLILFSLGFEVVLTTVTSKMREILRLCHIRFHPVAIATRGKLIEQADIWGNYYSHDPLTGIIDVRQAIYPNLLNYFSEKFCIKEFDIKCSNDSFLFRENSL